MQCAARVEVLEKPKNGGESDVSVGDDGLADECVGSIRGRHENQARLVNNQAIGAVRKQKLRAHR